MARPRRCATTSRAAWVRGRGPEGGPGPAALHRQVVPRTATRSSSQSRLSWRPSLSRSSCAPTEDSTCSRASPSARTRHGADRLQEREAAPDPVSNGWTSARRVSASTTSATSAGAPAPGDVAAPPIADAATGRPNVPSSTASAASAARAAGGSRSMLHCTAAATEDGARSRRPPSAGPPARWTGGRAASAGRARPPAPRRARWPAAGRPGVRRTRAPPECRRPRRTAGAPARGRRRVPAPVVAGSSGGPRPRAHPEARPAHGRSTEHATAGGAPGASRAPARPRARARGCRARRAAARPCPPPARRGRGRRRGRTGPTPNAPATASATSAVGARSARGTHHAVPVGARPASSRARRVFPTPGPTSVTARQSPRSRPSTVPTSAFRPSAGVRGTGMRSTFRAGGVRP